MAVSALLEQRLHNGCTCLFTLVGAGGRVIRARQTKSIRREKTGLCSTSHGTNWSGYAPDLAQPADLEAFWSRLSLRRGRRLSRRVFEPVETGLTLVDTYDVTFSGFAGQPIRAWLHIPSGTSAPLPVVVRYQGYGGGRGLAHEVTQWPLAGYVCLSMDTRGQGSAGSPGDTPDPVGSAPAFPGFMTKGILDPDDYYYRRVFTDAVMAVDAIRKHPLAEPTVLRWWGPVRAGVSPWPCPVWCPTCGR